MRRKTQVIEIPLREGIYTNEAPSALGPRLRVSQNLAWQPAGHTDAFRRVFSKLSGFNATPFATMATPTGGTGKVSNLLRITDNPGGAATRFVIGMQESQDLVVHNLVGTSIYGGGAEFFSSVPATSAAAAYFASPTGSFLATHYFGHLGLTKLFKIVGTTVSQFTPTNPPSATYGDYAGQNGAMIVHGDRLWFSHTNRLFFSDPFDANTVRPESVYNFIPGQTVLALSRVTTSPVDAGAALHLAVGTFDQIHVIDGDPQFLESSVARQISQGVGILDQNLIMPTSFGALLIGTDGRFYMIPAGAQELVPILQTHNDLPKRFNETQVSLVDTTTASFAYLSPYAFVCMGTLNDTWVLDFSLGNPSQPRVWGPVTFNGFDSRVRLQADTLNRRVFAIETQAGAGVSAKIYKLDLTDTQGTARTALFSTGFFHVPNHRSRVMRVGLLVGSQTPAVDYTVILTLPDGSVVPALPQTSPAATPGPDKTKTLYFTFAPFPTSDADSLALTVVAGGAADCPAHRAWVEIREDPKAAG